VLSVVRLRADQNDPHFRTTTRGFVGDNDLGFVPASDTYFLGRMDMSNGARQNRPFMRTKQPGFMRAFSEKLTGAFSMKYLPLGFMQMIVMDDTSFDRAHYDFKFVRREFLGDVRCIVVDVSPKKNAGIGRLLGRIWVEDQEYNIIRFNGTYAPAARNAAYLHFDSWRMNMRAGLWLPAYVYSEESDMAVSRRTTVHFKAQTRLWGYDQAHIGHHDEYSAITVDSPKVQDQRETAQMPRPYRKLGNAGLFLQALQARQKDLPNLLNAHLGNSLAENGALRMSALMNGAPQLQQSNPDQIAALPLGARIHMDAWSDKIEMTKTNRVPLISPREKMSFEVTPVFPYVTRFGENDKPKVAAATAPQQ
jgi:hypothetical protein